MFEQTTPLCAALFLFYQGEQPVTRLKLLCHKTRAVRSLWASPSAVFEQAVVKTAGRYVLKQITVLNASNAHSL